MAVFAALLALGLLPANALQHKMDSARTSLLRGRAELLAGNPEAAAESFATAEDRFAQARGEAGNPLLRFAGWLPILGRTPDAAVHLSVAGREVAAAGRTLAEGLSDLPGGLGSLGPRDGRLPVDAFEAFAPSVAAADRHLRTADEEVAQVAETWLLGPVADARVQFENQLRPLRRGLAAASLIVSGFPEFLGSEGERRYLFAAENPAELRGTGGLIGAVSLMTVRDGRVSFSPFEANEAFPRLPAGAVEPPSEEYDRRYPEAALHVLLANQTPDFPSAGVALQRIYEASRGEELDGVIAVDPYALEAMLTVSGAVEHPALGRVNAGNVVELMTNRAYSLVPGSAARNAVFGAIAQDTLTRFLDAASPAAAAEAIARSAGEDHLSVLTADEEFQRGLRLARADGALPDADDAGDALGVFVNNGGGNKVDYYAERTIDYRVTLGDAGVTNAIVAIDIHNGAPTSGQPRYVIGPNRVADVGENISLLDLFVPAGTELLEVELDGEPTSALEGPETGYAVFRTDLEIPSGETSRVEYRLGRTGGAWEGTPARGSYRLTLAGQTTLVPTQARVQIQVPEGTSIVRVAPGMKVQGSHAVWEGTLGPDVELAVEFQKALPFRAWDAVVRFLRTRLITF